MKNITVSVDDDTYRRARLHAAAERTSVSALVRRFLDGIGAQEPEFARLLRQEQEARASIDASGSTFSAGVRLGRDELHDRSG